MRAFFFLAKFWKICYSIFMGHFICNNLYALSHFLSPAGRDSRQRFCDVYKGFLVLALLGIFLCVWRNTIAVLYLREWLVISEIACWVLVGLFELCLLIGFTCATVRRWQDLDIRIPAEVSCRELIQKSRFWHILSTEEGSNQSNQYGPAPKENPAPLISDKDIKEDVVKKILTDGIDFEELK